MAPAVGSSLAGFFLAVYPGDQLRITIAIYIFTRALEFSYNYLEERGYFKNRPYWFGSWMLMPMAYGQLLHAFVFDRDCFPSGFGDYIMGNSPEYIQQRPADLPVSVRWPGTYEIVDGLAEISKQRWPPFISPILLPHIRPSNLFRARYSTLRTLPASARMCSTGFKRSPRLPASLPLSLPP
jgi:hypothetical protein